eukprot:g18884.t1
MGSPAIHAAPTSVWVAYGEEETHRCRAGNPLRSPQGFLMANPPGPYTCVRSVEHRSAAMLQFHLNRLWESAEATGLDPATTTEGLESLERRTTETIAKVMESFWEENKGLEDGCPECMTTVLYAGGGSVEETGKVLEGGNLLEGGGGHRCTRPLRIVAHAWPLLAPARAAGGSGVQVLVAGSGRSLPRAKHSSWLRDRKTLEELKAKAGAQEVLLSETTTSPEGASRRLLLEGLTSNFFVVEEDGAVCTSASGILCGAVRQLVLSACEHQGIPMRLEAPDTTRTSRWREAFLTGTGRILTPVTALVFPEDGKVDDTTIIRVDPPASKTEEDAHRGCGTVREDRAPSVAQALRSILDSELARTATRLF